VIQVPAQPCVHEMLDSNMDSEVEYSDWCLPEFFSVSPSKCWPSTLKWVLRSTLLNFIIWSFCLSRLLTYADEKPSLTKPRNTNLFEWSLFKTNLFLSWKGHYCQYRTEPAPNPVQPIISLWSCLGLTVISSMKCDEWWAVGSSRGLFQGSVAYTFKHFGPKLLHSSLNGLTK
jgi:hypothetical protein